MLMRVAPPARTRHIAASELPTPASFVPTSSQARQAPLVGVKTAEEAAEGCRRRRLPRLGHVRMLRRTGRVAVAGATWTSCPGAHAEWPFYSSAQANWAATGQPLGPCS